MASGGGKTDITKVGLNSIENPTVKNNLMGRSTAMRKKGWTDAQGRKGKGMGVYRFEDKYGANVDGYSPIYTPDLWSNTGATYNLGAKGLIAWYVLKGSKRAGLNVRRFPGDTGLRGLGRPQQTVGHWGRLRCIHRGLTLHSPLPSPSPPRCSASRPTGPACWSSCWASARP